MGRNRNKATILLGFEVDKSAKDVKQALRGMSADIAAFDARLQGVSGNAGTASAGVQRFTDATRGINREMKNASRYTESFAKAQDELRNSVRPASDRIRDQISNLDDVEKRYREASDAAAGFGDTASNLNAVRGLGETLGADLGGAQVVAEVFDAAEGLKRLGPALNAAVAGSSLLSSAAGVVATVSEAAGIGLTGTALSLTTIAAVAAPFVVAFAGLAAVFQQNQEQLDAYRVVAEARNQVAQDSLTLTSQEAADRRTALEAERAALLESTAVFRQTQDSLDAMNLGVFTGAVAGLFGLGEEATVTAEQAQQAEARLAEINAELGQLDATGTQANITINDQIAAIMREGDTRQQVAQDIDRLTTEQANAELEANRLQRANIEQTLGRLRELGDTQAAEEIAALETQLGDLEAREQSLTAEIIPAISAREQETAAIEGNRAALLNAASAERDAVQERARLAGLTAEQIRDEVAARDLDVQAIEAELAALRSSGDTSQAVTDRISELETELSAAQQSAADLRAAEPAALFRETATAVQDASQAIEEVRQGLRDAQTQADNQRAIQDQRAAQALARTQSRQLEDYARETAKRQQSLLDKEADALASLQADLANGQTEAETERLDIIKDAQAEDQKALVEHNKKLAQIERDGKRAIQDAAANLDAIALFNALQNSQQQVDQETSQFDEQRAERQAAAAQQLADLQTDISNERAERIAAYNAKIAEMRQQFAQEESERQAEQQLRQRREAEDRAVQQQQQTEDRAREDEARRVAAQQRIDTINAGLQEELTAIAGGEQRRTELVQQGTQQVIGAAQNFASAIQGVAARIQAAAANARSTGGTTSRLNAVQQSANRQNYATTGSYARPATLSQSSSTSARTTNLRNRINARSGGYQAFATGGVVQGAPGEPVTITAHAGEGIFTAEQMRALGRRSVSVGDIVINAAAGSNPQAIAEAVRSEVIALLESIA